MPAGNTKRNKETLGKSGGLERAVPVPFADALGVDLDQGAERGWGHPSSSQLIPAHPSSSQRIPACARMSQLIPACPSSLQLAPAHPISFQHVPADPSTSHPSTSQLIPAHRLFRDKRDRDDLLDIQVARPCRHLPQHALCLAKIDGEAIRVR